MDDIFSPGRPGSIRKITATVPATKQVDLQDMVARRSQRARLQRRHAARLVHFFGERMQIKDRALSSGRRVVKTKALPASVGRKKASCWTWCLRGQLALDKVDQRADRRKGRSFDFVIIHRKAKTVLQCREKRDDRHRIEFRHCTEKRRIGSKAGRAPFKAENFVQDGKNFLFDIQR